MAFDAAAVTRFGGIQPGMNVSVAVLVFAVFEVDLQAFSLSVPHHL